MWLVFFSFAVFRIFFFVLYAECFNYDVSRCFSFGPDGLVFCKLPIPGWLFLQIRKFSIIILLNTLSMSSVCNSSPSSTPMIHRVGLFMEFQISCMFHSYFLSIFSWSFTSSSNFIFCLMSLILYFQIAPICSVSLWLWFMWGNESLFWGFSGLPYLYWFLLSYPGLSV
jgi:hypothetical protein